MAMRQPPKPRREPTRISTRSRGGALGDEGPKRVARLVAIYSSDVLLHCKFETLKLFGSAAHLTEHLGVENRGTLRDDNLAAVQHDSVLRLVASAKVDPTQHADHFEALLLASEHAVQAMLDNPAYASRGPDRHGGAPKLSSSSAPLPDDGFGDGPRAWIFQANENIYDICSSVQQLKVMTWFIRQHVHRVHKGDRVYIWVSGKDAGIIAVGSVLSEPRVMPECKSMGRFYLVPSDLNKSQLRSEISVDYVLPERILKTFTATHPLLRSLAILRAPIGTNFRLSKAEATAIHAVIVERAGPHGAAAVPPLLPTSDGSAAPAAENTAESSNRKRRPSCKAAGDAGSDDEIDETTCETCKSGADEDKLVLCDECGKVRPSVLVVELATRARASVPTPVSNEMCARLCVLVCACPHSELRGLI
eukprot:TRINITY_DN9687_c0_g2_i1.p1 TRINITY_DN9687_c0_g2~~TRINITY_DN9687_c0_g2_i1.p1  ORF type:complete len:420 (+),score=140.56 TRINITY_DN9687_c0_g2_i1:549-1808(+)